MRERAIYALAPMPSPGKDVRRKSLDKKARIRETNFVYFILHWMVLFVCFVFLVFFFLKNKVVWTVRRQRHPAQAWVLPERKAPEAEISSGLFSTISSIQNSLAYTM